MSDLDLLVAQAELAGIARVYKVGDVPKKPTYPYAVLAAYRMTPNVRTLDGSGNDPRRFSAQIFGRTSDALEDLADLMFAAFDGVTLTEFDDDPLCQNEVTTPPYRDPDDDEVLNVTHTYRY